MINFNGFDIFVVDLNLFVYIPEIGLMFNGCLSTILSVSVVHDRFFWKEYSRTF
jgi:hypothetical protein